MAPAQSIPVGAVIAVQTALLGFLQFGDRVLPSNFFARKTCHAGSGALMLLLDPTDPIARTYVYTVVVTSLSMTWKVWPKFLPTFRFGEDYDVGITAYLSIVASWFYMQRPVRVLAPLFFADPAGAVVGKFFTRRGWNMKWWDEKSVMGTLAVFIVALLTIDVKDFRRRALLAVLCALGEAFGGKTWDNVVIAAIVIGGGHALG